MTSSMWAPGRGLRGEQAVEELAGEGIPPGRHDGAAGKHAAEVLYVGREDRMARIRSDPLVGRVVPVSGFWRMEQLADIARGFLSAREGGSPVPPVESAVLGFMCLPSGLVEHLLAFEGKTATTVILDGVGPSCPEVDLALEGIEAFCHLSGVELLAIP